MEQGKNFGEALQELINLLEEMTGNLMLNDMNAFQDQIPELSGLLETCFPRIIISYSDPLLAEVASDATYWSGQLGQIIEALNQNDKFVRIDTLYQETRANLIAYYDMIRDTPIAKQTLEAV